MYGSRLLRLKGLCDIPTKLPYQDISGATVLRIKMYLRVRAGLDYAWLGCLRN